ncbi:unnamed protein product [Rangifer tarandus platyrhynchus]|uniref:Uncharacterized protein n=2 Tax=Rangifer tarandus platyrhynchus TaxID=3082113 RepID=A0ABN8Y3F3_RANTA|nr:unnamed protein product [Rangifer tarandus platyrhynchus]
MASGTTGDRGMVLHKPVEFSVFFVISEGHHATLRTPACQTPLPMGFYRQEYWNGLLCPLPGDLPDPEIEPASLMSPALAGGSLLLAPPGKPIYTIKATSDRFYSLELQNHCR